MKHIGLTALAALLVGCTQPATSPPSSMSSTAAVPVGPTPAFQWLYGSGEAAAASLQAFRALSDYAVLRSGRKEADSVVLAPGSPMAAGTMQPIRYASCGTKPRAVIFDADETLILNAGYAYWQSRNGRPFDAKSWDEWERTGVAQVIAAPGAIASVARLRAASITPIVVSNRNAAHAAVTAQALEKAGLGRFVHRETMFLRGDDETGSDKDARRSVIAQRYCVVAMAGDNLGDFADVYNRRGMPVDQRRGTITSIAIEGGVDHLWGKGWFMLPNPTYGPSIAGDTDTIFPAALRWEPREGTD